MRGEQIGLFEGSVETIDLGDAKLTYYPQWLGPESARNYFSLLRQKVTWEQSTIFTYGRHLKIPRLNAWYGDRGSDYQYSGRKFEPLPWLPELLELKNRLENTTEYKFNSVLVNCYRNSNDSVSWHSDDETELGSNPIIASISLGAEREFQLRHRCNKSLSLHRMALTEGSLLVMDGSTQNHWQHQLPKTKQHVAERINLTYRLIVS